MGGHSVCLAVHAAAKQFHAAAKQLRNNKVLRAGLIVLTLIFKPSHKVPLCWYGFLGFRGSETQSKCHGS